MKQFDIIVIGSGGGTKLVSPAANIGLKVAIVEEDALGGTCLNRGCIPSKMLIHPSDLIRETERAAEKFELGLEFSFRPDFPALVNRVSESVDSDSSKIEPFYEKHPNITLFKGHGEFLSNRIVQVGDEKLVGDRIFIATGSRPKIPNIPGLEGTPYMTSKEALRNTMLPERLIVIGGGYIAVELGHVYSAMGSEVHMIVRSEMIRHSDQDIREEFTQEYGKHQTLHFGSPEKVSFDNGVFSVQISGKNGPETIEGDALLVAAGIVPNSDKLGLDKTDVNVKPNGFINVDNFLKTDAEGIYALGDVIGNYLFRHSVNFEGEYLFRTLYSDPVEEALEYAPVPYAVFTHPQIAGVGKTEDELRSEGTSYVVGNNPYIKSAMGSARLSDSGFVKVLIDPETKKLLGAHIIGDEASNMVHMFVLAMTVGATLDDLLHMIYVHPALPEIARNACRNARAKLAKLSD